MSDSFIIQSSSPSTFTSVPDHLPKRTISPTFRSRGVTLPSSLLVPFPTAVGNGTKSEDGKVTPLDLKVGDIVLFGKWSGTEVKVDGEELCIMKESDIMGVIDTKSKSKKKK